MQLALKGILGAILLSLSGAASAITWDWSFNGSQDATGSGTLTTTGLPDGSYLITGITGTWDGSTITGLEPFSNYQSDNLLFGSGAQLDGGGVYFAVSGQPGEQIYAYQNNYASESDLGDTGIFTGAFVANQVVATQAPEIDPNFAASGAALLVGALLVLRGRKQRAIAA